MRRFVVIGLGNFGMGVALGLARLGQKVTAVGANPESPELLSLKAVLERHVLGGQVVAEFALGRGSETTA